MHNFVHSGTRENVRHCYSTRATVSLAPTFTREIHTRYASGTQRRKMPDKPRLKENLIIKRETENLKMSRYVTRETIVRRTLVHDALSRDNRYAETSLI